MRTKQIIIGIVAVGSLLGWTALADDLADRLRFAPDQASFESQELTLDLAGIYGSRKIAEVLVRPGTQVEGGDLVIRFE